MSEERTLKSNAYFVQGLPFAYLAIECFMFILYDLHFFDIIGDILIRLKSIFLFQEGHLVYSRLFGLFLLMVSSVGTKPKKKLDIHLSKHVLLPIALGLALFFGSLYFYAAEMEFPIDRLSDYEIVFIIMTFVGAVVLNIGFDNISKIIRIGFMKDKFNVENESFSQTEKLELNPFSLNLPMSYYHNKRMRKGWFNLTNPFRGTLVIGTPESGKTFSIIIPFLKNFVDRRYTSITYDYKFPDLADIVYNHHLANKAKFKGYRHRFHIINLNDVEFSRRVNPLAPRYIEDIDDCLETAEALLQSLQKTVRSEGAQQFFTVSAINFLTAVFYFLSRFEGGKYSTLPHALSFINRSYQEIFDVLMKVPELDNIMSPFRAAYKSRTFGQLEGQIGTVRVQMARLATPKLFWVMSKDDFDLRISSIERPSHIIIANNAKKQSINSASNALILNRLIQLINTKGNHPVVVAVDELPTIYFHKIQSLIATARSNKVAVILGLQELPQLVESYGRDVANTITSVIGNVISGQARKKETLDWLQQLFGQVKQMKTGVSITKQQTTTSVNEQMGNLVPASKIADQRTGEIVAKLAFGFNEKSANYSNSNTYNCRIDIDVDKYHRQQKAYSPLPRSYRFKSEEHKREILSKNMASIKGDIEYIVQEARKIKNSNRYQYDIQQGDLG